MIRLVSTVRAPPADLERFVAYHRNLGVGRVHLFFDDPADPALPAFRERPGVEVFACTPEHWRAAGLSPADGIGARQDHNATLALAEARLRGEDWLLHVDSDELIHVPGHDLPAWLGRQDAAADAVVFPAWEAVPEPAGRGHPFEACRLFKTTPDPRRLAWAARAGCRRALRYGYFCGHMAGKTATRVASPLDIVGRHSPGRWDGGPVNLARAADAATLHYDGCTFESWREKWARRKDGSGLALNMRPDRRRQFDDFLAADATGARAELERAYRLQRRLPTHERIILRALGLARTVRLPSDLFAPPPA